VQLLVMICVTLLNIHIGLYYTQTAFDRLYAIGSTIRVSSNS